MNPASSRTRLLYLLALFQLVAGPLVLVVVTSFCQVTVREAPEHGLAKAASMALESAEVARSVDQLRVAVSADGSKAPVSGPKMKVGEKKFLAVVCPLVKPVVLHLPREKPLPRGGVNWTPVWSEAPPGPPPRLA